jgi:hypothetical protein
LITSRSSWGYILPSSRITSKNASLFGTQKTLLFAALRILYIYTYIILRQHVYTYNILFYQSSHTLFYWPSHTIFYWSPGSYPTGVLHYVWLFNLLPHDHPTWVILPSSTTTLQKNTPLFVTSFIWKIITTLLYWSFHDHSVGSFIASFIRENIIIFYF